MTVVVIGDNTGDDYSGTEDATLYEFYPTTNYGAGTESSITNWGGGDDSYTLLSFSGINALPSSLSVTSAIISLAWSRGGTATHTYEGRRLLRNWVENETTWNIWSTGNNWTTSGAKDTTNDRSATVSVNYSEGSQVSGTYYTFDDDTQIQADVEDFADGTLSNYGWVVERVGVGSNYSYWRTAHHTDGLRPFITVTFTVGDSPLIESFTDINEGVETDSFTVTKPAGLEVDDLLLAIIAKDDDPIIDLPAGWTRATASTAGGDYGTDVLYKIADSADAAATNFTFTGDSEEYCGRLYRISNVDTTTPIDVQDATGNTGTSTSPIANSVTTVTDAALVFAYAGMDDDDTPYSLDTAGWQEHFNSVSGISAGSCGIVIGFKYLPTAGATGNVAFTTNASDGWAACQFAIRPDTGAAPAADNYLATLQNVGRGVGQVPAHRLGGILQ